MTERDRIAVQEPARPQVAAAQHEGAPGGGDRAPAISVRGLSKRFRVEDERVTTIKERVLHPRTWRRGRELSVLNGVDFDIERGEFFSIVGRNGSGKSTLLKCLAGVYRPDVGEIRMGGRVSPFIELGVGFNENLNAFDNVLLNATLIGLTPQEARRRFPRIIEYAELEQFVEMKLKNYSTGMQMRLGFATAIQMDADVLLVDEVLAVGDAPFRRKCLDTFGQLKREGRTIVFVSHDPGVIRQLSDRVMVLEGGDVVTIDRSERALAEYERLNTHHEAQRRADGGETQFGDGSARILDVHFEDEAGQPTETLRRGEQAEVRLKARFVEDMDSPVLGVSLVNAHGGLVLTVHNLMDGDEIGPVSAGETRTFVARFPNWLAGGTYFATAFVLHADARWAAVIERGIALDVKSTIPGSDAVVPPSDIEVLAE